MGAGAYVCGEESALLESAEGKRGEPRDRPPFPVQTGYLDLPTTVNNVETLAAAARILDKGAAWFKAMGTAQLGRHQAPQRLRRLRPAGRLRGRLRPDRRRELLELVGGADAKAVQVGGPSGTCVAPAGFGRKICFDDLATGGSVIVFGPDRDLLEVVRELHGLLRRGVLRLVHPLPGGQRPAQEEAREDRRRPRHRSDLDDLEAWGKTGQDHEPLRPRPDLAEPDPDHAQELPPSSTRPRSGRARRSFPSSTWRRPSRTAATAANRQPDVQGDPP